MEDRKILNLIYNKEYQRALNMLVPIIVEQENTIKKQGKTIEKLQEQIDILKTSVGRLNSNYTNTRGFFE